MMRSDFLRSSAPYRRYVTYKLRKEKMPTLKKSKESYRHIAFSSTRNLFPPTTLNYSKNLMILIVRGTIVNFSPTLQKREDGKKVFQR